MCSRAQDGPGTVRPHRRGVKKGSSEEQRLLMESLPFLPRSLGPEPTHIKVLFVFCKLGFMAD